MGKRRKQTDLGCVRQERGSIHTERQTRSSLATPNLHD